MGISPINALNNYPKGSFRKFANVQTSPVLNKVAPSVNKATPATKGAVSSFTILVIGGVIAAGLAIAAAIDSKINSKDYSDKDRDDFIDDMLKRSMYD